MKTLVVDIADMKISTDPETSLVTYSLGSCLGVTVYDPVAKVGGMIHCMLPLSKIDPAKAAAKPFMFVDVGVPLFLQALFNLGVRKGNAIIKAAGCASVLDHNQLFNIGERNYIVFRKILWKNGLMIAAEDVSGTCSRTMYLNMETGATSIKSEGRLKEI